MGLPKPVNYPSHVREHPYTNDPLEEIESTVSGMQQDNVCGEHNLYDAYIQFIES